MIFLEKKGLRMYNYNDNKMYRYNDASYPYSKSNNPGKIYQCKMMKLELFVQRLYLINTFQQLENTLLSREQFSNIKTEIYITN